MIRYLFFAFLLIHSVLANMPPEKKAPKAEPSQKWLTLNGDRPLVIARGGFSGLFPESSSYAYQFALSASLPDVVLYCDLQLTKDGTGICHKDIRLDNSTNIAGLYRNGEKTYIVNGQPIRGWFAVDYTEKQIFDRVTLSQSIYSRPNVFDDTLPLSTVEDVTGIKPPKFWLNVPYDIFYKQHKVNVGLFIQQATRFMGISYISSPEVGFLKSLGKLNKDKTKIIFQFLNGNLVEPTTNQTYSSLLKDLVSIKTFASGILVPKEFIWPTNAQKYLEAPTTLVADAHKARLEVYASGFANDMPGSFNYSYDPTAEYLQFVDNSNFAVDGVLSDFPPTASEAIGCLAQTKKNKPGIGPLIISHNGASGVYAASSDLAYQQAVDDGADIIDCSVQMSKDGVAFCSSSADLMGDTTAMTTFMARATSIPEIQKKNGIFSFDLTWSEIQSLKPQLANPEETGLPRNPENKNKGKIISLSEFLDLAKAKAVSGILIDIENAPYLASKKGLSITDAVAKALTNATFDKQVTQQVFIQSDDTSVLSIFNNVTSYKRVLTIKESIGDAPKQSVDEIKKFADAVNLRRPSIIKTSNGFTNAFTDVVEKMHFANVSVYVSVLRNEYTTIAFDFFSDPITEMATYKSIGVDGFVTEYPATASAYKRSPCYNPKAKDPYSILPAEAGGILSVVPPEAMPPVQSPAPTLKPADVIDPPLPPVIAIASEENAPPADVPTKAPSKNGHTANAANVGLCLILMMALTILFY